MKLYWKERRAGQQLVLVSDDGTELEGGGIRGTALGFNAFAKTVGYDPSRARNGIATMEEAKAFVESFSSWEPYEGGQGLSVDPDVKPFDSRCLFSE